MNRVFFINFLILGSMILGQRIDAIELSHYRCLKTLIASNDYNAKIQPVSAKSVLNDLIDQGYDGFREEVSRDKFKEIIKVLSYDRYAETYTLEDSHDMGYYLILTNNRCKVIYSGFMQYF